MVDIPLDDFDSLMKTPVATVDVSSINAFRSALDASLNGEWADAPTGTRSVIRARLNAVCAQLMGGVAVSDGELIEDARLLHTKLGEVRGGEVHQQRLSALVPIVEKPKKKN